MRALLLTWNLLCAGDATTTHVALTRGAYEQHLSQNPWVTDAIVAGQAGLVTGLSLGLRQEHPRVAKALVVGAVVLRGYAVANNLHVIRRLR